MNAGEAFRCKRCGDLIGVYEPLVVYAEGLARTTSRAAEPDLEATGAIHYHRACFSPRLATGEPAIGVSGRGSE